MDVNLSEAMKNIIAKGIQTEVNSPYSGTGYITEKLYILLQLYLQNKGYNPSIELVQCFTELKESSMLPSATYLQMLASRIALDSQGRLVLRENGKIILPFEHFANAVMLKHMNGPHGFHLSLEATVRAVIESYTMGRDNFGMEKEFIGEVVQNCAHPTCRFYKTPLDLGQSNGKLTYIYDGQPPVPIIHPNVVTNASSEAVSTNMAPPLQRPPSSTSSRPPSRPPSVDMLLSFESCVNKNPRVLCESPTPSNSTPVLPPSPKSSLKSVTPRQQQQNKLADFLKANLDNFDDLSGAGKDAIDGVWPADKRQDAGQEKIIRAFSEIMKNMSRMKSCVRPAMCKPYGKQSEALQKTVIDTIQLVQSLRSFLPPPHIAVSSWKNEDKHSLGRKQNTPVVNSNAVVSSSVTTNANVMVNSNLSINVDDCNNLSRLSKVCNQE